MEPQPASAPATPPRRGFFRWLLYGLWACATAAVGIPFVVYVAATQKRRIEWKRLGPVAGFPEGETRVVDFDNPLGLSWDGITAHTQVFVRNLGKDQFLVLAVNCAHLGCPVSWFPQSGLFMCPCHGGVYYANGNRASGPPPRGLFQCVSRIQDGSLEIQAPHYPTLQDTLDRNQKQGAV
jgi:Rieske Fe-S protein